MTRRQWLSTTLALAGTAALRKTTSGAEQRTMTVQKRPGCGCCDIWAAHLRKNGFTVEIREAANVQEIKTQLGVPAPLQSCHTGRIDGYIVEGHVPAADILRLLKEHRAGVVGLAVPGMPVGSPGMEGGAPERYDVVAFRRDGSSTVFASH
jgi:hypothetical protein